jgi:hypothetical protein
MAIVIYCRWNVNTKRQRTRSSAAGKSTVGVNANTYLGVDENSFEAELGDMNAGATLEFDYLEHRNYGRCQHQLIDFPSKCQA